MGRLPGRLWRGATALGLAALLVAGVAAAARAAGPSLAVDRQRVELSVAPGESQDVRLNVSYQGAESGVLEVQVHDFDTLTDGSFRLLEPAGWSAPSTWIQLAAVSLPLQAEQPTPLRFRVQPASGTPPGDYGALLLLQLQQPPGGGVVIQPQLAVRVYTRVAGAVFRRGYVSWLAAPAFVDLEMVRLSAHLVNTGSAMLDGAGALRTGPVPLGPLALGQPSPPGRQAPASAVMPNEDRDLAFTWEPPGYGLYWLELDAHDADVSAGLSSWVLVAPWRAFVLGALVLPGLWILSGQRGARLRESARVRLIALLGGEDRRPRDQS